MNIKINFIISIKYLFKYVLNIIKVKKFLIANLIKKKVYSI